MIEVVLSAGGLAVGAGRHEQTTVRLTFPRGVRSGDVVAAVRTLTGLLPPWWRRLLGAPTVTLEVAATADGIEHVLTMPATRADFVLGALRAAIPGLRITRAERIAERTALARELRCTGHGRLRTDAIAEINAGVLAGLQPLRAGERAVVQLVIAPLGPRPALPSSVRVLLFGATPPSEGQPEPELAVAIRVGVSAGHSGRARQLMARVLGAFHPVATDEARFVRRILPTGAVAARLSRMARPDQGASALAADELAAVLGVPIEGPQLPGLVLAGGRELVPSAVVPRDGLVIGDSTVPGPARPVAVAFDEARRGVHLCAPTGSGKSTLLCWIARQVMQAGQGLVLIDSKGDLAADVADRVPRTRQNDAIMFDPADRDRPVGFNLLGGAEASDLIVDHVVGQFRARYGAIGLGPRSEDILRAALLTLAGDGRYTVCEVEPLLTNAAFRQRLVGRLEEPVLEGFWAWFASLSEAARAEAVAPLANKLRSYTVRRRVRAVIGQADGLDLAQVLDGRRVLIVSLAKGTLGEDAAALIGAAMTARLWTAIQARAALPPRERQPVTVICDEFQDFAALPLSFGDAVAQSRGYGVGWVLAHQHLGQLDASTRQAVLANCRSRVVMQTTASDARAFAAEFAPHLDAADLQGLGPFEAYAAVSVGASVAPPASIRTRPMPEARGSAEAVRNASRTRYGTPAADVARAIRKRVVGRIPAAAIGGKRRTP